MRGGEGVVYILYTGLICKRKLCGSHTTTLKKYGKLNKYLLFGARPLIDDTLYHYTKGNRHEKKLKMSAHLIFKWKITA